MISNTTHCLNLQPFEGDKPNRPTFFISSDKINSNLQTYPCQPICLKKQCFSHFKEQILIKLFKVKARIRYCLAKI